VIILGLIALQFVLERLNRSVQGKEELERLGSPLESGGAEASSLIAPEGSGIPDKQLL